MFGLLAMLFAGREIIKESRKEPLPPFNWGMYRNDCRNGVDVIKIVQRRNKGYYNTSVKFEPVVKKEIPKLDKVNNVSSYEDAIKRIGFEEAEKLRKMGLFLY